MNSLPLPGCAPIPLAHYLKALGVLRLISENEQHGDPRVAGRWERDVFVLHSKFDREGLVQFFLRHYSPTPILAPWNGGSGFYFQEEKLKEKDPITGKRLKTGKRNLPTGATRVVELLAATNDVRFQVYKDAICLTRKILSECKFEAAPDGAAKDDLLVELRNRWPDAAIQWLDCVVVLAGDFHRARSRTGLFPNYTTLLGSGANDGNADFSSNFMQRLQEVLLNPENQTTGQSQQWLVASLFGTNVAGSRIKALAGQYSPGTAGGPNALSGFKGEFSINPWDFVFLIEGALFFAAAAVRRHGVGGNSGMAYPFAVRTTGVGYASASANDELADKSNTEELWLPLWNRPTRRNELLAVLSEGRAQVGQSAARTGVDFARAVCANGTDRGFSEFVRYGFLIRRGDSSSATPLGRFAVRRNARVDLLSETDRWLGDLRRAAGSSAKQVPASVSRALNQLENRILDLCKDGRASRLRAVLVALGQAERALARSLAWTTGRNDPIPVSKCQPLSGLSARWLREADDGKVEFRLAASLASITGFPYKDKDGKSVPLHFRQHLEPVAAKGNAERYWFAWDEQANDVVWNDGDFVDVLNRIFSRRLVRAEQSGLDELPDNGIPAPLADVVAFIEGETDDALLADLMWGLSLLNWNEKPEVPWARKTNSQAIPSALFNLLRLAFPRSNERKRVGLREVPPVLAIYRHAAAGNGREASRLASRRLRASDMPPAVTEVALSGDTVRRTAAALPFPISAHGFEMIETASLSLGNAMTSPP